MVDMTLIRPLNKGQGHPFWYHTTYDLLQAVNSNVCSRTHHLATIIQTTDATLSHKRYCTKYGRLKTMVQTRKIHCTVKYRPQSYYTSVVGDLINYDDVLYYKYMCYIPTYHK